MTNPILDALQRANVSALKQVTNQVPLEPRAAYQERRLLAEIAGRSTLQEACQACVSVTEATQQHPEYGFVTAMTCEVVVMSKPEWVRMLTAIYNAGLSKGRLSVQAQDAAVSAPPLQEKADG